ncbi:MAG: LLM class F420-dependent oxidoreductase [Chloroflexota bacterium]
MKLGLGTGYWSSGPPPGIENTIQQAEDLGYDSMWAAEAYGSDAITPLAWWGAKTTKIKLGTSIAQISARQPAALAMAAMTLDHLSGGRVILGIGASGPQVVEGWYGQPYPKPLERTREYVDILRKIFKREERVGYEGKQYQLPYMGKDGMGLGKALKSTLHPFRTDIPIYLAAEGPKNVSLAAEIADGWLPLYFTPKMDKFYRDALNEGFAKRTDGKTIADFEVAAMMIMIPTDDMESAANFIRPNLALYMGGMGARGANFHHDVFVRMGWGDVAKKVQDLYLAGDKQQAAAMIPLELVQDVALIGPMSKIKDDLEQWKETCLTTMMIAGPPQVMEVAAKLVL